MINNRRKNKYHSLTLKLKKIAVLSFLGFGINAYAVPSYWSTHAAMMGEIQYHLPNEDNNLLKIVCNHNNWLTGGYTYVELYEVAYEDVRIDSYILSSYEDWQRDNLSFLFDEKYTAMPISESSSTSGANAWRRFINGIATARKIEVFSHNKKVATFYAKNINSDEFSDIASVCAPTGDA